ncbi:nitrate reductase subunit beta [Seleniivibrio woodruffii]|uniref:nitrate reductase subunit beta n=1 Tax=Seleniivibrio woodruffii TaxID=1078050 RepID=UPI00240A972A|nr:nitrate reductase subunit beta [Seleniivibrio woodruffii]
MEVRAQLSMVLNLDKCIGCHACSVACKNMWTNRRGAEYMWWNNVETKPGTGYPSSWEDQNKYNGGWEKTASGMKLKMGGQAKLFSRIFYNPDQPVMKNYYEPWTYQFENLINAPDGDVLPTARAVSQITGEFMDIKKGPNWDDDLSGSDLYAVNDPNLTQEEQQMIRDFETVFMFHLPRLCNHCLNPACAASCPSGAIYKRGEDGIVLVNQEKCKSWRYCVTACPYKKVYYNWNTQKSEKCIMCFPRIENGEPTLCAQSCPGKIRSLGVLLYDLDALTEAMTADEKDLVEAFRSCVLDPKDPKVKKAAAENGITAEWIKAAENSVIYSYVKELGIALPLHPEFRTFPSFFYVPPLSPVVRSSETHSGIPELKDLKIPARLLADKFTAGNVAEIERVLKKLLDIRRYKRALMLKDEHEARKTAAESLLSAEQMEKAYRLFTQAKMKERMLIPMSSRGEDGDPYEKQGCTGFGIQGKKGWRK